MSIKASLIANAQIYAGSLSAEPQVRQAIHDWIKDDAGMAIKVSVTPALVDQLLARITIALLEGNTRRG